MEQVEYVGVTHNLKKTVSFFQVIMALFSFWPELFKGPGGMCYPLNYSLSSR